MGKGTQGTVAIFDWLQDFSRFDTLRDLAPWGGPRLDRVKNYSKKASLIPTASVKPHGEALSFSICLRLVLLSEQDNKRLLLRSTMQDSHGINDNAHDFIADTIFPT